MAAFLLRNAEVFAPEPLGVRLAVGRWHPRDGRSAVRGTFEEETR
jgi:hypothetical protein